MIPCLSCMAQQYILHFSHWCSRCSVASHFPPCSVVARDRVCKWHDISWVMERLEGHLRLWDSLSVLCDKKMNCWFVFRLSHTKWRETRQQLSLWPELILLYSCLVSLPILFGTRNNIHLPSRFFASADNPSAGPRFNRRLTLVSRMGLSYQPISLTEEEGPFFS